MNTTYYLLHCPCGRKIPVQPPQAGEIVTCACGVSLEVPTLLALKALERTEVPSEPNPAKTAWGAGHRLIFLGVLIIIASVAIGGWLFFERPTDPFANLSPEQIKEAFQKLSPSDTWRRWLMYEKAGPTWPKGGLDIFLTEQKSQNQIYWWLLGFLAGAGLACVAAGIIVVHRSKKKVRG